MYTYQGGAYMRSGEWTRFVQQGNSLFIWETIPDFPVPPGEVWKTFSDFSYHVEEGSLFATEIKKFAAVFLMLDTLGVREILPLFPLLSKTETRIVIINIGVGISGVVNKHTLQHLDISQVLPYLPVYEPVDQYSLKEILKKPESMYIRIGNDEALEQISHNTLLYNSSYFSLTEFGYSGMSGTIITQASLLPVVSQALQFLKAEEGLGFDLFICVSYDGDISDELGQSIQINSRCLWIHDQEDSGEFFALQKDKILSQIKGNEVSLQQYHAKYSKVTVGVMEYMYDQAGLSAEQLADRIRALL